VDFRRVLQHDLPPGVLRSAIRGFGSATGNFSIVNLANGANAAQICRQRIVPGYQFALTFNCDVDVLGFETTPSAPTECPGLGLSFLVSFWGLVFPAVRI